MVLRRIAIVEMLRRRCRCALRAVAMLRCQCSLTEIRCEPRTRADMQVLVLISPLGHLYRLNSSNGEGLRPLRNTWPPLASMLHAASRFFALAFHQLRELKTARCLVFESFSS